MYQLSVVVGLARKSPSQEATESTAERENETMEEQDWYFEREFAEISVEMEDGLYPQCKWSACVLHTV